MFLRLFLFGSDVKCLEKSAAHSKGREKTKKEVKKETKKEAEKETKKEAEKETKKETEKQTKKEAEKRLGEKIWIQERYWKK